MRRASNVESRRRTGFQPVYLCPGKVPEIKGATGSASACVEFLLRLSPKTLAEPVPPEKNHSLEAPEIKGATGSASACVEFPLRLSPKTLAEPVAP